MASEMNDGSVEVEELISSPGSLGDEDSTSKTSATTSSSTVPSLHSGLEAHTSALTAETKTSIPRPESIANDYEPLVTSLDRFRLREETSSEYYSVYSRAESIISCTDSTGLQSQYGATWLQSMTYTANSGFASGIPRTEGWKGVREGREKGMGLPAEKGVGRTGKAPAPVPPAMIEALRRARLGQDTSLLAPLDIFEEPQVEDGSKGAGNMEEELHVSRDATLEKQPNKPALIPHDMMDEITQDRYGEDEEDHTAREQFSLRVNAIVMAGLRAGREQMIAPRAVQGEDMPDSLPIYLNRTVNRELDQADGSGGSSYMSRSSWTYSRRANGLPVFYSRPNEYNPIGRSGTNSLRSSRLEDFGREDTNPSVPHSSRLEDFGQEDINPFRPRPRPRSRLHPPITLRRPLISDGHLDNGLASYRSRE